MPARAWPAYFESLPTCVSSARRAIHLSPRIIQVGCVEHAKNRKGVFRKSVKLRAVHVQLENRFACVTHHAATTCYTHPTNVVNNPGSHCSFLMQWIEFFSRIGAGE